MADVLSQSEMEFLLTSLGSSDTGQKTVESANAGLRRAGVPGESRRAGAIESKFLKALRARHQGFACHAREALGRLLRTDVDVEFVSVDVMEGRDLAAILENPACSLVVRADPPDSGTLLDICPTIVSCMIGRLLGGSEPDSSALSGRDLTGIERKLLSRIFDTLLTAYGEPWSTSALRRPQATRIEQNSRRASAAFENDQIAVSRFDISMGQLRGAMLLVHPRGALELATSGLAGAPSAQPKSLNSAALKRPCDHSEDAANVVAILAETRLSAQEIAGLAVGDVILTDGNPSQPVTVCVGSRRFDGQLGQVRGKKAVRIDQPLASPGEVANDIHETRSLTENRVQITR